eukprot:jgi/Ulvmu1/9203/UM005_0303.1
MHNVAHFCRAPRAAKGGGARKKAGKPGQSTKAAAAESTTPAAGPVKASKPKRPKEFITGDPIAPLLKVHNGHIVRHAQTWLTPHPHVEFDDDIKGPAPHGADLQIKPPPHDISMPKACPIERSEFYAVRTVYELANESSSDYQLQEFSPQSRAFHPGHSQGVRILKRMWDRAMASDNALQGFQWLPGAPPVVQLQPRHAAADRVQRAAEREVLKCLMETFEDAFCSKMGSKALAKTVGLHAANLCIVSVAKHKKRICEARTLNADAVVALSATAACRMLLLLFKHHPRRSSKIWPHGHADRCKRSLVELHGIPEQRKRAAYMAGFMDEEALHHRPTAAEQAAVKTPPLPFAGCKGKLYKHMTVLSTEQGVRTPGSVLHAGGIIMRPSAGASDAAAATATAPAPAAAPAWPGVPSGSAPITLVGDCVRGYGPQDRERWAGPVPVSKLLVSMSIVQHMEMQRLGWQAVIQSGKKELPQNSKWNVTLRPPGSTGKRRKRVRSSGDGPHGLSLACAAAAVLQNACSTVAWEVVHWCSGVLLRSCWHSTCVPDGCLKGNFCNTHNRLSP